MRPRTTRKVKPICKSPKTKPCSVPIAAVRQIGELKYEPYYCKRCKMTFSTRGNLVRHLRNHSKIKRFSCDLCDKHFTTKSSSDLHVRAVHQKLRPFQCTVCNKYFSQKPHLRTHLKTHRSSIIIYLLYPPVS